MAASWRAMRRLAFRSRCGVALLLLLLASCRGEVADDANATASGEVLPGSISDAMIPLDSVRSEAPLMEATPAPDEGQAGPAAGESAAGDSTPEETPPDEPAAEQ